MVFISYIIALFLVCFGLGFLILLFTKSKIIMMFGFFFIILAGIILVSSVIIQSETILFLLLGFFAISLILTFSFRDELIFGEKNKKVEINDHE